MSELGLENLVKVAVHHDRCEKIQELSENVTKLKDLMKQNLGKLRATSRILRVSKETLFRDKGMVVE